MAEVVRINERYRLRRMDEKNYILEEFRKPKSTNAKKEPSNEPGWYAVSGNPGFGPFFSNIGGALVWLLDRRMITDPGECASLEDAIARMREIADELKGVSVDG